MNGIDYLADTNAILYILSGNECMKPFTKSHLAVSDISFMELLSFPSISVKEENTIRRLLNSCELLHIDEDHGVLPPICDVGKSPAYSVGAPR